MSLVRRKNPEIVYRDAPCRVAGSGKHDPAITPGTASGIACGKCGDELALKHDFGDDSDCKRCGVFGPTDEAQPCVPTVMPARELATMLGLNIKSVYAGAAAGDIPARRVGTRWIFVRAVIEEWLRCR